MNNPQIAIFSTILLDHMTKTPSQSTQSPVEHIPLEDVGEPSDMTAEFLTQFVENKKGVKPVWCSECKRFYTDDEVDPCDIPF